MMINLFCKVNVLFTISILQLLLISDFFQCVISSTKSLSQNMACGIKRKLKRALYRHQVLPALGGKIPESAFYPHRLNNNLLSRNGIYSNDGLYLQQYYFKNTHGANDRYKPSTIKLRLPRNNNKVAPPGRYYAPEIIDTTYVLRENSPDFPVPKLNIMMIHKLPEVPQHSLEIKEIHEQVNSKEQNYHVEPEETQFTVKHNHTEPPHG